MRILFLFFSLTFFSGQLLSQGGCHLLNLVKVGDIRQVTEHLMSSKSNRTHIDCFKSGEWLSPLMVAVQKDDINMVKLLLTYGADMNQNLSNKKAIDHSVSPTMKSFLEESGSMSNRLVEAARSNDTLALYRLLESSMIKITARDSLHHSTITAAAEGGHANMIKVLLARGCPVDYVHKGYNNNHKTALQFASEKGHLNCVKVLVEAGADLEGNLKAGWTPLMLAIQYNFSDIAKYLIEKGANMKMSKYHGSEPYSLAAYRNEFELLKFMLNKYNVIGSDQEVSHGILSGACHSGNLDMFNYLIEKGLKPVKLNPYKGHNLLVRAAEGGNLTIVKKLVEDYQFEVNSIDEYKFTPLSTAVAHNTDIDITKYLLEKGAEIDGPGHAGYTPITRAIGKPKIITFLLKKGASPNPKNVIQSPLSTACAIREYESVKILVKYGADVHAAHECTKCLDPTIKEFIQGIKQAQSELAGIDANSSEKALLDYLKQGGSVNSALSNGGKTPLVSAAETNNIQLAKELIKLGANVNLKSHNMSPVTAACYKDGSIAMIDLLVKNGAELDRTPSYFRLDILGAAVFRKDKTLIDYLLKKDVDINYRFEDSSSIMHAAAQTGDIDMFKYLIEKGGNPNHTDKTNKGPFMIAVYHGDMAFITYMVEELNVDVNQLSTNGAATAIKNATWLNSLQKVSYLLEHGADPYLTIPGQEDAIQWAFQNKHIDSLHTFYTENGYRLKAEIGDRHNVFDNMYKQGVEDRIVYAIQHDQTPDNFDTTYAVRLMYTAMMKQNTNLCDTLLKYGADINGKDLSGNSLLWSVQDHSSDVAAKLTAYLIEHGANANIKNGVSEQTVLMKCMIRSNYDAAENLLKAGANPNVPDKSGNYPWFRMSLIRSELLPVPGATPESRNTKMLKLFKAYGANLKLKNEIDGNTALLSACMSADFYSVKYLHEVIGLDVNDSTKYGNRPLFQTLQTQGYTTYSMEMPVHNSMPFQEKTFRYLLKEGANPNFYSRQCQIYNWGRNGQANNFIFYCAYSSHEAFDVLLDQIDPNMIAHEVSLVSFLAKQGLKIPLEKVLQKGGKVVNPKTGKSAMDHARNDEIKRILKKYS